MMSKAEQKKRKLFSLPKDTKVSYTKPVLMHYGSIVSLTSGCGGSGADSIGSNGNIGPSPDGTCRPT
jgi:hypothetical protein